MICGRTRLIIRLSKAKNCKESAGDVGIDVAPQKPNKNIEKCRIFGDNLFPHVEKQNVGNRPKRVLAKFRRERIRFQGVNARSKFSILFSHFFWPQMVP